MSSQSNKDKSIQEAIRAIHKQFGSGSIMRLDNTTVQTVDVIRLSGAPEDDAQTLTTANWLAANLTTQESRKFLVSIQPLVGAAKADALDAEAKRVGLSSCALSEIWRRPDAVPPP